MIASSAPSGDQSANFTPGVEAIPCQNLPEILD
jgi:hypothetical protein